MKTYTEAELVSFGNFMLRQDKRKRKIKKDVANADLFNWKLENEKSQ